MFIPIESIIWFMPFAMLADIVIIFCSLCPSRLGLSLSVIRNRDGRRSSSLGCNSPRQSISPSICVCVSCSSSKWASAPRSARRATAATACCSGRSSCRSGHATTTRSDLRDLRMTGLAATSTATSSGGSDPLRRGAFCSCPGRPRRGRPRRVPAGRSWSP